MLSGLSEPVQYRQEYSASFLFSVQAAFLEVFDSFFTVFYRWPLLAFRDMFLKNPTTASQASFGPLEWFAEHPVETESGVFILTFMGLAKAFGFWKETEYQNEIRHQFRHQQCEEKQISIQGKLNELKGQENFNLNLMIEKLNDKLINSNDENEKKFFAKFKDAKILNKDEKPYVKLHTPFNLTNIFLALWMTIFLSAFYFWIGSVVMMSLTATITVAIAGCSFFVSFIIPIAISALTYMGSKFIHWKNHRYSDGVIKSSDEAYEEAELLEYLLNQELEEKQRSEMKFVTIPEPQNVRELARNQAVIGLLSGFLQSQYILWILSAGISDYLQFAGDLTGTLLASNLGIVSFIVSIGLAYKAYTDKCSELAEKINLEIKIDINDQDLDKEIKALTDSINNFKSQLDQKNWDNQNIFCYFFEKLGKKECEFFNNWFYKLLCDFVMSSVFVARVFLLPNTSPFLPAFLHMAAIAAVTPNPATWALMLVAAVAWSAFRHYAKVQEDNLKDTRKETIQSKRETYITLNKEKTILEDLKKQEISASYFSGANIKGALSKLGLFCCCLPVAAPSSEPEKLLAPAKAL